MFKKGISIISLDSSFSSNKHSSINSSFLSSVKQNIDANNCHQNKNTVNRNQIIEQELAYLQQKIQIIANTIHCNLSINPCQETFNPVSNGQGHSFNSQLVMVIEKKMQIVVSQVRKWLTSLGKNIEEIIKAKMNQKYSDVGIIQLKDNYNQSINAIEQHYRSQVLKISRHYAEVQNKMVMKAVELENKLINKVKDYQAKEKVLTSKISKLEQQLRERQQKLNRVIQVTMGKTAIKQVIVDKNKSGIIHPKVMKIDLTLTNNNSFLNDRSLSKQRKKIFEGYKSPSQDSKLSKLNVNKDRQYNYSTVYNPGHKARVVTPKCQVSRDIHIHMQTSPQSRARVNEPLSDCSSQDSLSPQKEYKYNSAISDKL